MPPSINGGNPRAASGRLVPTFPSASIPEQCPPAAGISGHTCSPQRPLPTWPPRHARRIANAPLLPPHLDPSHPAGGFPGQRATKLHTRDKRYRLRRHVPDEGCPYPWSQRGGLQGHLQLEWRLRLRRRGERRSRDPEHLIHAGIIDETHDGTCGRETGSRWQDRPRQLHPAVCALLPQEEYGP